MSVATVTLQTYRSVLQSLSLGKGDQSKYVYTHQTSGAYLEEKKWEKKSLPTYKIIRNSLKLLAKDNIQTHGLSFIEKTLLI